MRALLLWTVVGLAAGWLASDVLAGPCGIVMDLLLGIVGAFVGGFLLNVLVTQIGPFSNAQWQQFWVASQRSLVWTWESMLTQIAVAFLGALLLLALYRLLFATRRGRFQHA